MAYAGSDPALNDSAIAALTAELDSHLYMTAREVCDFVQRTFGVGYIPNAMTKLLTTMPSRSFMIELPTCWTTS